MASRHPSCHTYRGVLTETETATAQSSCASPRVLAANALSRTSCDASRGSTVSYCLLAPLPSRTKEYTPTTVRPPANAWLMPATLASTSAGQSASGDDDKAVSAARAGTSMQATDWHRREASPHTPHLQCRSAAGIHNGESQAAKQAHVCGRTEPIKKPTSRATAARPSKPPK